MEWIKVSDKLPKNNQCVIGYDGDDLYFFRFIQTTDKRHKKYDGVFECSDEFTNTVTHWMPLPELPIKDR